MAITISGDGITSANIADGTITNADIDASAAIADTKLGTIAASKLTGALPAIDGSALTGVAGGKVLQVVTNLETSAMQVSSSALVDIITATITPTSASSKILAMVTWYSSTDNHNGIYAFKRNNGDLNPSIQYSNQAGTDGFLDSDEGLSSHVTYEIHPTTVTFEDSPSSTSALTYALKTKTDGTQVVSFARADANSSYRSIRATITLMEIGA